MKSPWMRSAMVLVTITLLIGLFATPPPSAAKRGQSPECQEECLTRHTLKMHELSEKHRRTGDRLTYQNDVETLILEYRTCLENCREPYPVK